MKKYDIVIRCHKEYYTHVTTARPIDKLKKLSKRTPLIRASDAIKAGVPSATLFRLKEAGAIQRIGRGLYQLANSDGYSHSDLVEASILVPKGVIVLLSALNFHGIGTHPAWEVWVQIPANFPTPRISHPPLRIIRSRIQKAFTEGVETHTVAGHPVRVTDVDRTIVDCFKHRNTVTLEVCLEALRERLKNRKHSLKNIHHYANLMGVSRVMRPYLEALA
jgi:predicted transcriptional regulator of viral defense system